MRGGHFIKQCLALFGLEMEMSLYAHAVITKSLVTLLYVQRSAFPGVSIYACECV